MSEAITIVDLTPAPPEVLEPAQLVARLVMRAIQRNPGAALGVHWLRHRLHMPASSAQ